MTEALTVVGPDPSSPERAAFVRQRLVIISKHVAHAYLENGLLLKEYKDNGYFREDGFKSFNEAIDAMHNVGTLEYGARNARHFIAVVEMKDKLGITLDRLREMPISKLREIATIENESDQRALLEASSEMTTQEVQDTARKLRHKELGRDEDPLKPLTLMFTETQYAFFREVIERARGAFGLAEELSDATILVDTILADYFSGMPSVNNSNAVDADIVDNNEDNDDGLVVYS